MRSRWQLVSLVALIAGALALAVFALQLGETQRFPARHGAENVASETGEKKPRVSQVEPPESAAELPPLKAPPPKPATKNNPESNKVWFRLLDAETNRPIANTPAIFASFDLDSENKLYWRAYNSFGDDKTDPLGLFCGDFWNYSKHPQDEPRPGETVRPDDANLTADEVGLLRNAYPLAKNYEPGTPPSELEPLLLAFAQGKYTEVIDVKLRKMRKVTGTVLNSLGQPVAGAGVFAVPQRGHENDRFLQEWSYYYMDIPPTDEAWERPGTRTAKIFQRHFEYERPTITAVKGASIEPRGEHTRPDRFRYTAVSKWATFWTATTDAQGRFEIAEMPRGEWVVGAWHTAQGYTSQLTTLIEYDGELTITLPNDNPAHVELTIEWLGERTPGPLRLQIGAASLYGDFMGGVHADFQIFPDRAGPWVLVIDGLREGIWQFSTGIDAVSIPLTAGSRELVALRTGPSAWGKFRPHVRIGDAELVSSTVQIEDANPPVVHVSPFPGSADSEGWFCLPAGQYIATVAGAPPFRFSLTPGQVLESEFRPTFDCISFSIDAALFDLLSKNEMDVLLSLAAREDAFPYAGTQPPGIGNLAPEAFSIMDEADTNDAPAHDLLVPGRTTQWRIPRGIYEWKLHGNREDLYGVVDLRTLSGVHFSISNLPGIAALECRVPEAFLGEPWRVEFENKWASSMDAAIGGEPGLRDYWISDAPRQEFLSKDGKLLYVFALPGRHALTFSCNGRDTSRIVSVPGSIEFRESDFEAAASGIINLKFEKEPFEYSWVWAVGESLSVETARPDRERDPCLLLREGTWRLFIIRRNNLLNHRDAPLELGRLTLVVTRGESNVELATATYQTYGSMRIELSGRAPADLTPDPWWQQATGVGLSFSELNVGGFEPFIVLSARAFHISGPSLQPTLVSESRILPPGRYKIIPWPGAPDSACKIVTVEPGKECVVRFEGR